MNRLLSRLLPAVLALSTLASVGGCGGGERAEPFVPTRIYAFGDELSLLQSDGRKYGVNYWDSSAGALDCATYPLWIQTLASHYGMAFEQCPGSYATFNAVTRATVGATVAGLEQQVSSYLLNDQPTSTHLVTMLVGSHDVLAAYQAWLDGARGTDAANAAQAAVKVAAENLALQVNRVVQAGAPVLIGFVPDLGYSPYAQAQEAAYAGEGRAAMLSTLTTVFNNALQSSGQGENSSKGLAYYGLGGTDYGLILDGSSWVTSVATGSSADSYNATPLCLNTARLPDCTSLTLASGADVDNWVWADGTRPGVAYQAKMGSRAVTQATNLPF
ncbi:hypothetical protein [Azohydromonas aeria]|uniref:hypothetical protein n=1 Tax=Azohydromonas aeria TaxID=2590212 RepID=UPI0018DFBE6B|nr:hypothetical protein [Azohydromonas aeria]